MSPSSAKEKPLEPSEAGLLGFTLPGSSTPSSRSRDASPIVPHRPTRRAPGCFNSNRRLHQPKGRSTRSRQPQPRAPELGPVARAGGLGSPHPHRFCAPSRSERARRNASPVLATLPAGAGLAGAVGTFKALSGSSIQHGGAAMSLANATRASVGEAFPELSEKLQATKSFARTISRALTPSRRRGIRRVGRGLGPCTGAPRGLASQEDLSGPTSKYLGRTSRRLAVNLLRLESTNHLLSRRF